MAGKANIQVWNINARRLRILMNIESEELEREPAICSDCQAHFAAPICRSPFPPHNVLIKAVRCEPCVITAQQRRFDESVKVREEREKRDSDAAWSKVCPLEFRSVAEGGQTDLNRLRSEQSDLDKIVAHPLSSHGLILRGGTGTGKTRCMYRLLRAYHESKPRPSIEAVTAGQFDRQARDAAGTYTLSQWFNRIASADILFIDDLGKAKWTPATIGQFWELIDDRTSHGRPFFATTNLNAANLIKQLDIGPDIGDPLIRRLREHCSGIILRRSVAML